MLTLGKKRRQIEDSIVEKANRVDFSRQDASWLDDEKFFDFIYAWFDLARYYEQTSDTTMSADLLGLYMTCAARLKQVSEDNKVILRRREKAESALLELNYQVDHVIVAVERNTR